MMTACVLVVGGWGMLGFVLQQGMAAFDKRERSRALSSSSLKRVVGDDLDSKRRRMRPSPNSIDSARPIGRYGGRFDIHSADLGG